MNVLQVDFLFKNSLFKIKLLRKTKTLFIFLILMLEARRSAES